VCGKGRLAGSDGVFGKKGFVCDDSEGGVGIGVREDVFARDVVESDDKGGGIRSGISTRVRGRGQLREGIAFGGGTNNQSINRE
jgi:hypothetical protein